MYCVITVDLLRKIEDLSDVTKNAKKGEKAKVSDNKNDQEKRRFTLWVKNSTMDEVEKFMDDAGCKKTSEFIERAILFYCGYLKSSTDDYVPKIVMSTLKGLMHENENRHNGSLFRIAVELSMIKNLLAFRNGIGETSLNKLRSDCISEVKKINGTISYEEAIRWQT